VKFNYFVDDLKKFIESMMSMSHI